MGNIFAASEIVELGIQIERNGQDFYNLVAQQAKNPKAQEIFKYLALEEEKHINVFKKILSLLNKYEPPEVYSDEYLAYMRALASEHVFTEEGKGKEIAKGVKTDREAIELGLGFEQDSIIFYEGMKKVVPQDEHKIIDELILQEQNHFRQLTELKKKIG